ncbi:hypothetical protein AVEN_215686-1 [Araneus ventricosus]|uniref:Uncharacterized protein n=1 Tax=Araneus ventricosus TaxID=182803 RepID=A0A4Y2S6W2_ARAVE|nr:hypothetical protein AVEN_215686-1 [Araneus ventricosus]
MLVSWKHCSLSTRSYPLPSLLSIRECFLWRLGPTGPEPERNSIEEMLHESRYRYILEIGSFLSPHTPIQFLETNEIRIFRSIELLVLRKHKTRIRKYVLFRILVHQWPSGLRHRIAEELGLEEGSNGFYPGFLILTLCVAVCQLMAHLISLASQPLNSTINGK